MDAQQFCLKWDGFQGTVTSLFDQLRHDGELVDITLCCDGQRVRAHRMMLSACSPYFRQLIQENTCQQLVFFLKDTSAADLRAIIEFIYKGSVNVAQSQLASFIKTAEMLQIRGLSGEEDGKPAAPAQPTVARSPAAKRRRLSEHDPPAPPPPPAPAPSPGSRPPESPNHTASSDTSTTPSPPISSSAYCPLPPHPEPLPTPLPAPHPTPVSTAPSIAPPAAQMPPPAVMDAVDPMVKVEKVDEVDEDVSGLDDTLGYVAEYEGGYQGRGPLDVMMMAQMAGALGPAPGPSQRIAEDGSSQGAVALQVCPMCGAAYHHRRNLAEHMKRHTGQTTCCICHQEFAMTFTLRRHMMNRHGMTPEEVSRITNKRGAAGTGVGQHGEDGGAGGPV